MSSKSKSHTGRVLAVLPAIIAVVFALTTLAAAQDQPAPKWEIFGGYSFLYPNAQVHGQLPGALLPLSSQLESNPRGVGASVTYNFHRWIGLTLDGSTHWGSGESTLFRRIDDAGFSNLSVGPKVTFRSHRFSPFIEFLMGDHRLMPDSFHDVDKFGIMPGAGLDLNVSHHVALRLLRADYVYSNYKYGAPGVPETHLRGARLRTGIHFSLRGQPAVPPMPPPARCTRDS